MTLTQSSALHYWSSRYGPIPIIGGKPVHTRNSSGAWVDQQGVLQAAIVNTPRFEHATIASERRPVMRLEPARTNGFTYSEELDNAVWTKTRASITANAALAPDMTLTADLLVEDSTASNSHEMSRTFSGATDNKRTSFSAHARATANREWIALEILTKANVSKAAYFNIATGAIGNKSAGVNAWVSGPLVGGGWRISISVDVASGGTTPKVVVYMATGDGVASYSGDGVSNLVVWGLEIEVDQPAPSSYVKTTSATATRASESFYWDFLPPPLAMMAYLRLVDRGTGVDLTSNPRVFQIGKDDNTDPRLLLYHSATHYSLVHSVGGTARVATLAASPAAGDVVEFVAGLQANGGIYVLQSINGGAVTDASAIPVALAAAWSDTKLWLNSVGSTSQGLADHAEVKIVKYADVVATSNQGIMDELREFELNAAGEVMV